MELIANTGKSKVFRIGDKAYKFVFKKSDFDKELKNYKKIEKFNIPNIIKLGDVDIDINMISMDFYEYNLEEYFANKYDFEMNPKQTFNILYNLTLTLGNLHQNNITHGDFKAKNIMLDGDLNPVVIDFDMSDISNVENDIKKFHFIIYQLLYKVEYTPTLYNNFKKKITDIEIDFPLIAKAMKTKDLFNLLKLIKNYISSD
tara:strand:+ start:557 stop:1162 length:606 start_codon:yes stop_codon:yes gene_type:complete